jgi:hypothetical protein
VDKDKKKGRVREEDKEIMKKSGKLFPDAFSLKGLCSYPNYSLVTILTELLAVF